MAKATEHTAPPRLDCMPTEILMHIAESLDRAGLCQFTKTNTMLQDVFTCLLDDRLKHGSVWQKEALLWATETENLAFMQKVLKLGVKPQLLLPVLYLLVQARRCPGCPGACGQGQTESGSPFERRAGAEQYCRSRWVRQNAQRHVMMHGSAD